MKIREYGKKNIERIKNKETDWTTLREVPFIGKEMIEDADRINELLASIDRPRSKKQNARENIKSIEYGKEGIEGVKSEGVKGGRISHHEEKSFDKRRIDEEESFDIWKKDEEVDKINDLIASTKSSINEETRNIIEYLMENVDSIFDRPIDLPKPKNGQDAQKDSTKTEKAKTSNQSSNDKAQSADEETLK